MTRLAVFAGLLLLNSTLHAETHALLIGVSGYPSLPAQYRLGGPRNDVAAMVATLRRRGVRDIAILADGVTASSAEPTRAAILGGLARLAGKVAPDDWVIVYFSGHGSQQPQPAQLPAGAYREPDGLDEIFLPLDVARWDARAGSVANGLLDDDIGRAIGAILRRGASVWAIFDTCHAGDMAKTLPPREKEGVTRAWRTVPPSVLGVPYAAKSASRPTRTRQSAAESNAKSLPTVARRGQLLAFYATQPDEPAPEESLLPGKGEERMIGVFTAYLTDALNASRASRRDFTALLQAIAARYRSDGRPFPTPSMEGPGQIEMPF